MNTFANKGSSWSKAVPGLSLMILAPLLAEILSGATRFSAIFVLPIEICVWGGGALFIRYAIRRWGLGWRNMLLLALALAVAFFAGAKQFACSIQRIEAIQRA
jgi:hypothetical protein